MPVQVTFELEFDGELTDEQKAQYKEFLKDVAEEALYLADLQAECGGAAASHPDFPLVDWMEEVDTLATRLGYWEWVLDQLADEPCADCDEDEES